MNRNQPNHNIDFTCQHCGRFVSSSALLAGVNNRNHCPYCLWSRHLDLWEPGDRLSACKGGMRPVALTLKATRKKYGPGRGELMLVHQCEECGKLSLNRIAADDDPERILALVNPTHRPDLDSADITLLAGADRELVTQQLFGYAAS